MAVPKLGHARIQKAPSMAVILSDGTIVRDDDPRAQRVRAKSNWPQLAFTGVFVAVAVRMLWAPAAPWADGKIPAAQRAPSAHWDYLYRSPFLVREFSRASTTGSSKRPSFLTVLTGSSDGRSRTTLDDHGRGIDFGGDDGSEFEDMVSETGDQKYVLGTRCSSTRFALSVYFCGADVANDPVGLWETLAPSRTELNGVDEFERFLKIMRNVSENGIYPTLVYRLGLGQYARSEPGLEHVWLIASMPDGTYLWLQSYIGHYSLHDWMKEAIRRNERYLTFAQLQAKLAKFRELRTAASSQWTLYANFLYESLFFVDLAKTDANLISTFSPDNAFLDLDWNPACAYPTHPSP